MPSVDVDENAYTELDPIAKALAYQDANESYIPYLDIDTYYKALAYDAISIDYWDVFTYDWTYGGTQDKNRYVPVNSYKKALAYNVDKTPWIPSRYSPITPDITPAILDLISLANQLKAAYNKHIALEVFREYREGAEVKERVHMQSDFINGVTSPNAYDLDSAIILLNEIKLKYNLHRTQYSVHGNVAVIRLDAPIRTLFNSVTVWATTSGIPNLMASFSDDEGGTLNDV